ncbi:hypothetical protein HC766_01725 [Candidatus Gracilibacteria bacterium]|nr:hypothetical protein [Candidatus Gracilibacteria bacterium]NJS41090.1 hypothetical protein [Candidatus Gracilibacteria bacterium]
MDKKDYLNGKMFWKIGKNSSPKGLILGRITLARRAVIGAKYQIVRLDELCEEENSNDYTRKAINLINSGKYSKVFVCGIKAELVSQIIQAGFDNSVEFYREYYFRKENDITKPVQSNFEAMGM